MSTSSEFVAICRAQVALLNQGLGAALSVVYLTEELVEGRTAGAKLIPIVAYPETAVVWEGSNALTLLPEETGGDTQHLLLSGTSPETASARVPSTLPESLTDTGTDDYQPDSSGHSVLLSTQIVLPLMHEGMLMGLLVTSREDRQWNEQERSEIERIAQTLAIARVLDRRLGWFEQQLSQQQRLQAKQRDLLDNLLHQIRNPLTALRTFGKLLLKRLTPGDANRAVADNIVRESDRLQELLQQIDRALALTTDEIDPRKSLPPTPLSMEATVQQANVPVPLLLNAGGTAELCSVADVLEPLFESARAIAGERNLDLQTDLPPNLPPVRANAKALREVLSNIIDNALKYTPDGGQIYIQAGLQLPSERAEPLSHHRDADPHKRSSKEVTAPLAGFSKSPRQRAVTALSRQDFGREQGHFQGIAISDTGLGIPPQDLEHIFERHYRGVQVESEIPGTGLGLAIALELIEQMQGEIQVFSPAQLPDESVAGGPGATFVVWLPVG